MGYKCSEEGWWYPVVLPEPSNKAEAALIEEGPGTRAKRVQRHKAIMDELRRTIITLYTRYLENPRDEELIRALRTLASEHEGMLSYAEHAHKPPAPPIVIRALNNIDLMTQYGSYPDEHPLSNDALVTTAREILTELEGSMDDAEEARARIKNLFERYLEGDADERLAIELERRYAGLHAVNEHVGGVPDEVLAAIGALQRIYQSEEYPDSRTVIADLYEKL